MIFKIWQDVGHEIENYQLLAMSIVEKAKGRLPELNGKRFCCLAQRDSGNSRHYFTGGTLRVRNGHGDIVRLWQRIPDKSAPPPKRKSQTAMMEAFASIQQDAKKISVKEIAACRTALEGILGGHWNCIASKVGEWAFHSEIPRTSVASYVRGDWVFTAWR